MRSVAHRSIALFVAAAWLVAACSGGQAGAPGGSPAAPTVACNDVPQTRCDEQAATFFRSLPNDHPTQIEVVCVSPPCTEDSGTTMMNITYADGHQLHSNPASWSGPGGPAGGGGGGGGPGIPVPGGPDLPIVPTCIGVPQGWCFQMASGNSGDGSHGVPISIVVRCSKACTEADGEGTTSTTFKDGTVETGGWGYGSSSGG